MDGKYLAFFLLSCFCPYSTFSLSDYSEEYDDEERFRPKYGTEIEWIDQGQDGASYKSSPEPAGHEYTYLCRAYHGKTWVPGKLIGESCYITKNRMGFSFKEFQVPKIPQQKRTRWVKLGKNVEVRQLPRNVIVGGHRWDSTAYICRGLLGNGVVIPGSYHQIENICYLGHNGVQVAWKGDTEILVLDDDKPNTPKA